MAEEKPSKGRRSKAAATSGDIYSEGEGEGEAMSARDSETTKKKKRCVCVCVFMHAWGCWVH